MEATDTASKLDYLLLLLGNLPASTCDIGSTHYSPAKFTITPEEVIRWDDAVSALNRRLEITFGPRKDPKTGEPRVICFKERLSSVVGQLTKYINDPATLRL